jgi:hypothetical protein
MRYLLLIVGLLGLAGCVVVPAGLVRHMQTSTEQQCDAGKPEVTPTSRFRIDEAAGTVFDTKTNLTWKRCAEGQVYQSGRCEGRAGEWPWDSGVAKFGIDGSGWRLPNLDELNSIVETRCRKPAINLALFPDTPTDLSFDWFWSSSPAFQPSPNAWFISFASGMELVGAKKTSSFLRLVRGEQWLDSSGTLERKRKQAETQKIQLAEAELQKDLDMRKEKEEKRILEEEVRRKITELLEAEKSATFSCPDKTTCDKAFSLTQIYLNQSADMKIQVATDTIVETYNSTEDGKLGLKAIRVPGKGASARIVLTATCKDEKGYFAETCRLVKLRAYQGFRPFIDQMLKG